MNFRSFLPFVVVLQLSCATIFNGSSENVSVMSNPASARVKVYRGYGVPAGFKDQYAVVAESNTPARFSLARENHYTVAVSLDGYETKQVIIDRNFNGLVVLNLLCGPALVGGTIDYLTGAFWSLNPTEVMVTLSPGAATAPVQQTPAAAPPTAAPPTTDPNTAPSTPTQGAGATHTTSPEAPMSLAVREHAPNLSDTAAPDTIQSDVAMVTIYARDPEGNLRYLQTPLVPKQSPSAT